MKRFTSVLIAVILGAFATGIGTIPFLVLANQDRNRLDSELHATKKFAEEKESEKQTIAEQANEKVKAANAEVQKAQAIIMEAQEDERLLTTSERLIPPSVRDRAKWNANVSLNQGISILTPNGYTVTQDDSFGFIIDKEIRTTVSTGTTPVIFIEPYDEKKELQYINSFASSSNVNYVAGGRLLKGQEGLLLDGSTAMLFLVRSSAKTTHLIWLRDPAGYSTILKKILTTIEFR